MQLYCEEKPILQSLGFGNRKATPFPALGDARANLEVDNVGNLSHLGILHIELSKSIEGGERS